MRKIEVVAAVLVRDGRVFATQRGYGEFKDKWEFPGGKMEAGEGREEALRREIREELDAEIAVGKLLCTVEYDYPAFHRAEQCRRLWYSRSMSRPGGCRRTDWSQWIGCQPTYRSFPS